LFISHNSNLILLWKDIDVVFLKSTQPGLLDIRAIDCRSKSTEEVSYEIISVLRPDIKNRINFRLRLRVVNSEGEEVRLDHREISIGPRRHEKLPRADLSRIHLVYSLFVEIFRDKFDDWVNGFCRDLDYRKELYLWEVMGSLYLYWCREHRYSPGDKRRILRIILAIVASDPSEEIQRLLLRTPEHVRRPMNKVIGMVTTDFEKMGEYLLPELDESPEIQNLFKWRTEPR
jgi:hypothetical protein